MEWFTASLTNGTLLSMVVGAWLAVEGWDWWERRKHRNHVHVAFLSEDEEIRMGKNDENDVGKFLSGKGQSGQSRWEEQQEALDKAEDEIQQRKETEDDK